MDYEVKGTLVLGYLKHLESTGRTARVRDSIAAPRRWIFERPPSITDWIAGEVLDALVIAVHDSEGPAVVRGMVSHSLNGSVARFVRPLGESLMRLFGATPHTLLSRVDTVNAPLFRGLTYRYTRIADPSCSVEVTYPRPPVQPALIAWDEALSMIVAGTAGRRPEMTGERGSTPQSWLFTMRW
jgi:hypothetical protein